MYMRLFGLYTSLCAYAPILTLFRQREEITIEFRRLAVFVCPISMRLSSHPHSQVPRYLKIFYLFVRSIYSTKLALKHLSIFT